MNYMDLNTDYVKSDIVILGIPYDGTTSYKPGARFAPSEIRNNAIIGYETYSPKLNMDLEDLAVHDKGDLEIPYIDPKDVSDLIYKNCKEILNDSKSLAVIGGEHSISFGVIKAYKDKYPDLKVIHLDAHTDLREEYLGSKYSHASVMKRVVDYIGSENLYQFGIRSGTQEEFDYAKENINFFPYNLSMLKEQLEKLKDSPVYITIDLDVLDPAFFPGTGTPEPDGVSVNDLFTAIYDFKELNNIVGFDIVELAPKVDNSEISTAVAIKVFRELLLVLSSN